MTNKYYHNAYGGLHGEDIPTPVGRAAFVYLDKPNTKFAPAKYGLTILFDKKDKKAIEQLRAIQAMCTEMATELFKGKVPKNFEQPIFRDGDGESSKYEGFPGNWYIVAKNDKRSGFTILDDVLPEAIEAGMLVRAQVQPYVDPKGFSYKLRGLRLVKDDGVRFKVAPDGTALIKGLDEAVAAVSVSGSTSLDAAFENAPEEAGNGLDIL